MNSCPKALWNTKTLVEIPTFPIHETHGNSMENSCNWYTYTHDANFKIDQFKFSSSNVDRHSCKGRCFLSVIYLFFSTSPLPPWLDAPPRELFIETLNQRRKLITKIYEAVIYSPLKEWDNTSHFERLNNQALTIFIWYHKAVCLKNDQATNGEMRMAFSGKTFWMRMF